MIHRDGSWRGADVVELATLERVGYSYTIRSLEPLGYVPPSESGAQYQMQVASADFAAVALK